MTVDGILESWGKIKPVIMEAWGEEDKEALIDLFGKVRDDWINNDLTTWIGANRYVCMSFRNEHIAKVPSFVANLAPLL